MLRSADHIRRQGSEDFQRDKDGKDYGGYGGSGNEDFHRDKGGKDYGGYGVVCFAKALKYMPHG